MGPYRWVRNPIYLAAITVVVGEAWLFMSLPLLAYAGAMAVTVHLFVIGYEEPTSKTPVRTDVRGLPAERATLVAAATATRLSRCALGRFAAARRSRPTSIGR